MRELEAHIQEVEISLEAAQRVVEFGEAIERLIRNPDFQTVIDAGYFTAEARRLTLLLADENITEVVRNNTHHSLRSIGELHQFLQVQRGKAESMKATIEEHRAELARAEQGDLQDTTAEGEVIE